MPFTTIKIIEGALSDKQKVKLIKNVTEAMEAEEMREITWEVIVKLKKKAGFMVARLSHVSQRAVNFSGRIQGSSVGQGHPLFRENDDKNGRLTG